MKETFEGFNYHQLPYRYVAKYTNGKWNNGKLTTKASISLNESACVLQYAQQVFEGLKAFYTKDDRIVCFRPNLNEQRLKESSERMAIPTLPNNMFLDAVKQVVKANEEFIPPYGENGALYLRPYVFGLNPVVGVKSATSFEFRVFATPVHSYFKGGVKPLNLRICDYDRAAPNGTGHIKTSLNYAMSLFAITEAHQQGFDENLYLNSSTHEYIEETGGANIVFIDKEGNLVTPKSSSILPSITRRSLVYIAENYLHMKAIERKIKKEELKDFVECGLCGTAAVISPVGSITDKKTVYKFNSNFENKESILGKLYKILKGIQQGEIEAPEDWILEIK